MTIPILFSEITNSFHLLKNIRIHISGSTWYHTENKLPNAWKYQPFYFHLLHYRDGRVAQECISMCANRAQEWVAAETCVEHLSLRCGEAEVLSQGCAK